jgi:hypothetical protein
LEADKRQRIKDKRKIQGFRMLRYKRWTALQELRVVELGSLFYWTER